MDTLIAIIFVVILVVIYFLSLYLPTDGMIDRLFKKRGKNGKK